MSASTPFQTETRSSRRCAANGGVDPDKKTVDPITHEVRTVKDKQRWPRQIRWKSSRRDRSRSPKKARTSYRTRESVAAAANGVLQLNLAHRRKKQPPKAVEHVLPEVTRRENTADTKSAESNAMKRGDAGPLREAAPPSNSAGEDPQRLKFNDVSVDDRIREAVEMNKELAARDEESITNNLEWLEAELENFAIDDRSHKDLEADSKDETHHIHYEQLSKHEASTPVDAMWPGHYPSIKLVGNNTLSEEYTPSPEDTGQNPLPRPFHDLAQFSYDHFNNLIKDSAISHDDATPATVASQRSKNYDSPFDWCSNPRCPIHIPHHAGPYLESGEVARQYNEKWGWSDPPIEVWKAWAEVNQGNANEYQENLVVGFTDAHYWEGSDTSDFLVEDEVEE